MGTNIFNPADVRSYPSRWPLYRGKRLFRVIDERSATGDEELLSVSHLTGITPRSQKNVTMFQSESLIGYKICQIGDIAANTMWAWQGAIGVSNYAGVVSPAYNVYRQKDAYYHPKYLDMLLREPHLVDVYHSLSTGIRSSRLRLYPEVFLTIDFPVPPRAEQDQIVRFLAWKVSEINKLIGIRRKEIQELEALKSIVITAAITKGIDPNAAMKKTDVYYLPEVPAAWEVTKLKRICKVGASIYEQLKKHDDQDEVVFLPMENISEDGEIDCSIKQPIAKVKTGFSSFAKNDVVVAKITPCFENGKGACLDKLESDIGYGTTELFNLRAGNDVLSEYLYFITRTKLFRILGEGQMTGSAGQKRVPADFIRDFTIGLPPIDEQQKIVDYIRSEKGRIDRLIATKHEQLKALMEFKSSVVSDVVTGKIDVRNVTIPKYEHVDDIADDGAIEDNETEEAELV